LCEAQNFDSPVTVFLQLFPSFVFALHLTFFAFAMFPPFSKRQPRPKAKDPYRIFFRVERGVDKQLHVRLQKVSDMQDKKLRDGFAHAQDILLPFLLCKTNRTVIVRVGAGRAKRL
jgi:hypothetical protein